LFRWPFVSGFPRHGFWEIKNVKKRVSNGKHNSYINNIDKRKAGVIRSRQSRVTHLY